MLKPEGHAYIPVQDLQQLMEKFFGEKLVLIQRPWQEVLLRCRRLLFCGHRQSSSVSCLVFNLAIYQLRYWREKL